MEMLRKDVRVIEGRSCPDFHARYSRWKRLIFIAPSTAVISPFWLRYAHHEARALDLERMKDSAALFLGTHDWTRFPRAVRLRDEVTHDQPV